MEQNFWHDKWLHNEIGFHQSEINPHLTRYWHSLNLPSHSRVFVPLCGKSRDLLWLREQGHEVIGVELSPVAVSAFFEENGLRAEKESCGALERWSAEGITLYVGDLFQLPAELISGVRAVYDRAALVALPPEMRAAYAALLCRIIPAPLEMLLLTLEYPADQMSAPPFSVDEAEIFRLYESTFTLNKLDEFDALAESPGLAQRGLKNLTERVHLLSRN